MSVQTWTYIMVGLSFSLYIGIAIWARARSRRDFYVAGSHVSPLINGMATAADWMSAASFISMAGLISFMGRDGAVYLMGWTGGYVLLVLLLLVISTSIAHDLLKKELMPSIDSKKELLAARISAGFAVCVAGYFGLNPPGFVAQVVAFAFGLAASSFFPAIIMGIFSKRMNKHGAISGMIIGLTFTAAYIVYFKFIHPELNQAENWWFGISPEGIGTVGMMLNFIVANAVSFKTPPPPPEIQELVERIRIPRETGSFV